MTVPVDRSRNRELINGATDGAVRKMITDRCGVVEGTTVFNHEHATAFGPQLPRPGSDIDGDGYEVSYLRGHVRNV